MGLWDIGTTVANTAKHHPDGLPAIADTVRQAGRLLESISSLQLERLERVETHEGGYVSTRYHAVVSVTEDELALLLELTGVITPS